MALTPEEEKELAELEAAEAKKNRIPGEEYLAARSQMAPGSTVSDEQRTRAIETSQNFEDQYLNEQGVAQAPLELDGYLPAMPQVLSTLPSQTGPVATPEGQSQGVVYVYEPPVREVQKRLLNDPQFAATLGYGVMDPQRIAQLNNTSSEYQAAADLLWAEAANAATGAGKTAYRYSQTPWLQDGQSTVDSLKLKATGSIQPASEGATAFILGVDDTALFGAVRAGVSALDPEMGTANQLLGIESAGGVPAGRASERLGEIVAEHPVAHGGGQITGIFSPEGLSNKLFTSVGKRAVGLVGAGKGALRGVARTGAAGVGAGVAGLADQAIHEGVDAASNLARTGDTGTTMQEAQDRILSVGPVAAGLGAGFHALGGAGRAFGNYVETTPRYAEAPRRFKQAGGRFELGRGPVVPAELKQAQTAARERDLLTGDVAGQELAPKLAAAEAKNVEDTHALVRERNAPFYPSEEGQMRIPIRNVVTKELELLDKSHAPVNGRPRPIGDKKSQVRYLREQFNNDIGEVSLDPIEGGIPISPAQADAYFSKGWKQELLKKKQTKAPPGGPRSPYAPAEDLATSPGEVTGKPAPVGTTPARPEAEQGLGPSRVINDPLNPRFGTGFTSPSTSGKVVPRPTLAVQEGGTQGGEQDFTVWQPPRNKLALIMDDAEGAKPSVERDAMAPSREANMRRQPEQPEPTLGAEGDSVADGDLERSLRRRGIKQVYVVPRRLNAEDTEQLIKSYQDLRDPTDPHARERKELYTSSFEDRKVRPMNGQPGAWNEWQKANHELISAAEEDARLVAPQGDAFKSVVRAGQQTPGELPLVEALRRSAQRAGVSEELQRYRGISPAEDLQQQLVRGKFAGGAPRLTAVSPAGIYDNTILRLLYPASDILASKAGAGGAVSGLGREDRKKKEREGSDAQK